MRYTPSFESMRTHIVWSVLLLFVAVFVLALSFWRLTFSTTREDDVHQGQRSVATRIHELVTPPLLPDHPLYIVHMIHDRIVLLTTPAQGRFFVEVSYADARLVSAQLLQARGKRSLALTTTMKAEKYLLQAARDRTLVHSSERELADLLLANTMKRHIEELTAMKQSFSPAQRASIDLLVSQLQVAQ